MQTFTSLSKEESLYLFNTFRIFFYFTIYLSQLPFSLFYYQTDEPALDQTLTPDNLTVLYLKLVDFLSIYKANHVLPVKGGFSPVDIKWTTGKVSHPVSHLLHRLWGFWISCQNRYILKQDSSITVQNKTRRETSRLR